VNVRYLIASVLGLILLIMDSEAFKLFAELAAYLLWAWLFMLFLWAMMTQGLVWTYG